MFADRFIHKALKRAARHARLLTLAEGVIATLLFFACWLFFEIILDHLLALPTSVRMLMLLLLTVIACLLFTSLVVVPFIRSINSLYVAKRVEDAFPQFKNSLITFIQLNKSAPKRSVLPLVAHQAAGGFQGIDIDASLDSSRFVRLGYVTVTLIIVVFLYSLFTPKSVWTSAMRAVYPWADIPAPTRTRISDIEPGTVRMLLGSDAEVYAVVYPEDGGQVSIKWSRDGELWQSVPMRKDDDRFHGTLAHVETNILYCVTAGDAVSRKFVITPLVPPIVESITVDIAPPLYTRLALSTSNTGSIEAAAGSVAAVTITSNKTLESAFIKIGDARAVPLAVQGNTARGSFTVERSTRYALLLTDEDRLSPSNPVEYDIVAIPDRPPSVSISGPPADDAVPLDKPLPFKLTASDEYGLTKLAFHFESDPSNADVRNFPIPPGTAGTVKDTEFVPKDLGARPGDTVSYYLQASDNRADRPNVSRTPTYTFKVADSRTSLTSARPALPPLDVRRTSLTPPGDSEAAPGLPTRSEKGATSALDPAAGQPTRAGDAATELAEMFRDDADVWDKIAKHMDEPASSNQPPRPASTQDSAAAKATGDFDGAPSPDSASASSVAPDQSLSTEPQASASTSPQGSDSSSASAASSAQAGSSTAGKTGDSRQPDSASSAADASAKSSGAPGQGQSAASASAADSSANNASSDSAAAPSGTDPSEKSPGDSAVTDASSAQTGDSSSPASDSGAPSSGSPSSSSPSASAPQGPASASAPPSSPAASSSDSASPSGSAATDSSSDGASSSSASGASSTASASPSAAGSPGASAGQTPSASQPAIGDASSSASSSPASSPGASTAASRSASPSAPSASSTPGSSASSPTSPDSAASSAGPGGGGGSGLRPYAPDSGSEGRLEPVTRTASPASAPGPDFARKHINRLAADMAAGRVNSRLLDDLNWRPSDLATFVRKYEDVLGDLAAAALEGEMPLKSDTDSGTVVTGRRSAASVGALDTAAGESLAPKDAAAGDIPREEVAPQYKSVLDEYYRSLAHSEKQGTK